MSKGSNGELFNGAVKDIFDIDEDLRMDERLRELILKNEQVAVFIGAGVSKLLGFPLWGELAMNSISYMRKNEKINFAEEERLRSEIGDPKQILSIFDKFCPRKEKIGREFYESHFNKEINDSENPYKYLVSPYLNWLKVTSNVDFCLADAQYNIEKEKFIREKQKKLDKEGSVTPEFLSRESYREKKIISDSFASNDIDVNYIYYLHGRIDEIENSIFTTEDYIKSYFKEVSNLRNFLVHLFENYNVIFIGYGLAELPILEAVMRDSEKEHFALMETKYHERNVFQIKERYFRQLRIKPIPYFIDHYGYERLTTVLKSWEDEIEREMQKKPGSYLDNLDLIDEGL